VLSSVTGDIKLELQYLPTLVEDLNEGIYDMDNLRYDVEDGAASPSCANGVASPQGKRLPLRSAVRSPASRPGGAQKLDSPAESTTSPLLANGGSQSP